MNWLALLQDFMDQGGHVLWVILLQAIWLWWMILERYWYFFYEYSQQRQRKLLTWRSRSEHRSWYALKQRIQLISEIDCAMLRNLKMIPTLIALLPMLGLLGTVTGMIQVFDVMAFLGSGNPRAMANGVSAATIPTMAGMVVAIVAIPFATALQRRYKNELRSIQSALSQGEVSDE